MGDEAHADIHGVISSQYRAALAMLRAAVERCPAELWDAPAPKNRFWHIAYHALFFTHLYLHRAAADFRPWPKHRDDYEQMGPQPWPPHRVPQIGEPFSRAELLEFLTFCEREVDARVPALDLAAESGFDWLPMDKLELQLYSIRHLQQHCGELADRLGQAGVDVPWVGSASA